MRKRRIRGTVQYLVKWLGYPDGENTWEAKKDIDPGILAAFETRSSIVQLPTRATINSSSSM
jgi:hypothetical protein